MGQTGWNTSAETRGSLQTSLPETSGRGAVGGQVRNRGESKLFVMLVVPCGSLFRVPAIQKIDWIDWIVIDWIVIDISIAR